MRVEVRTSKTFGPVAVLGARWWPQQARQERDKIGKTLLCIVWKTRKERPDVGIVFNGEYERCSVPKEMRCPCSSDEGEQHMTTPPHPFSSGIGKLSLSSCCAQNRYNHACVRIAATSRDGCSAVGEIYHPAQNCFNACRYAVRIETLEAFRCISS